MLDSLPSRRQVIAELRQKLEALESAFRPAVNGDAVTPTGLGPLNPLLPGGGLRHGSLVEWLAAGEGAGAVPLAFLAAAPWLAGGRTCVIVDERQEFYPAALCALGIELEQLLIVRPGPKDALWALEQALRCRGVAVTIGWVGAQPNRILRRLRLAAETGGGLGVFFRPVEVRTEPTWAHVRLLVKALPPTPLPQGERGAINPSPARREELGMSGRRARLEVLYCQGGTSGGAVEVEMHDETGDVRVAAPLAPARDARQAT